MRKEMIEQGSPEWFAARMGKITASRIRDMMAKTKTGPSASRKNYAAQLMLERVTGVRAESFTNAAMAWGVEQEPLARLAYMEQRGIDVEEVGFVEHPMFAMTGASPDGLIGHDGALEIKCGNTATHIEWAIAGKVPPEHVLQCQWHMACAERAWCDFVSYDPRMPEGQQLFVRRMERDESLIVDIGVEVLLFDEEINEMVKSLAAAKWF